MADITSVKDVFEKRLPERLAAKPDVAAKIGAVYQFNVSGPEGGTWTVDCAVPGGKVSAGGSPDARCTVSATDKDLLAIVNGTLNPQMAFMSGKLRIAGDIGLAMKLQLILV
jgi:putative sterol carrier protein